MNKRKLIPLLSMLAFPALIRAAQDSDLLVDDFNGGGPKIGKTWEIHCDSRNLGTKVNPFGIEKGSARSDKGEHGHFSGHLGRKMYPWPYALVELAFSNDGPKDLSAFKAVRFYAKGNGKTYRVGLGRNAVTDHCHFEHSFTAPKEWTLIVCPLDEFVQPDWGIQIAKGFKDVISLRFEAPAGGDDEELDLHVDDVQFVNVVQAVKKE
jgi:Carbohydrate binding domain (family 11)